MLYSSECIVRLKFLYLIGCILISIPLGLLLHSIPSSWKDIRGRFLGLNILFKLGVAHTTVKLSYFKYPKLLSLPSASCLMHHCLFPQFHCSLTPAPAGTQSQQHRHLDIIDNHHIALVWPNFHAWYIQLFIPWKASPSRQLPPFFCILQISFAFWVRRGNLPLYWWRIGNNGSITSALI